MSEGIKELGEIVEFSIDLANAASRSLEDGEFGLFDLRHFIGVIASAGPALKGLDKIPAELADLDAKEMDELLEKIKGNLEISDDRIKELLDTGISVSQGLFKAYEEIRKYIK